MESHGEEPFWGSLWQRKSSTQLTFKTQGTTSNRVYPYHEGGDSRISQKSSLSRNWPAEKRSQIEGNLSDIAMAKRGKKLKTART